MHLHPSSLLACSLDDAYKTQGSHQGFHQGFHHQGSHIVCPCSLVVSIY